jgi:uncharacterized membrane protein YfcA
MKPFFYGALIGILGGLMGLGGAEFRLPILTFIFDFATLHVVVINLIISWVTVISSLIFRWESWGAIEPYLPIVLTLLSGSILGAWIGKSMLGLFSSGHLQIFLALILSLSAIKLYKKGMQ